MATQDLLSVRLELRSVLIFAVGLVAGYGLLQVLPGDLSISNLPFLHWHAK
jgi:hypothetical protein